MGKTLVVSSNQGLLDRLSTTANDAVICTNSMLHALRMVAEGQETFKRILLNPNDGNYSALKFIEITLLKRPSIPIFLIDPEYQYQTPQALQFLRSHHIKGAFQGTESLDSLLGPKIQIPGQTVQAAQSRVIAGYIAVPTEDFLFSDTYPFDVYIENASGDLRFFAAQHSPVDHEILKEILQIQAFLYVQESSIRSIQIEIRSTKARLADHKQLPMAWKTAEILFQSRVLLNELRKNGVTESLIEQTQGMVSDVFSLMAQFRTQEQLNHFMELAKKSDRTMATTTLAILMCRKMRFERTSIVEILGLASVLQDISLYQSPYGNIAELNPLALGPEARKYFDEHPLKSADLVAQCASLPDVTLQVIRQHHERKDRSGFPNRIGGAQLQPMAEILSLINSFLDYKGSDYDSQVFSHYSDRVSSAFRELIISLKPMPDDQSISSASDRDPKAA